MSALKESMQVDCKKACFVMEQEYQHFDIFVKNNFNLFHGTSAFLHFLKYIRKPEVN